MKTVIHTNQSKGQSGTVKLINSVNSNQKKLRIDISINKGDNLMKIPHKTIINKQDKPFLGTVVSRSDSKNNNKVKTGAGVYITRNDEKITDFSIPLGISATIFQCEMYAIKTAAIWVTNQNLKPQNIYILSDSQAALKALEKQSTKSNLVIETNISLNNASILHNIVIIKVPAHTGLDGNEEADKLAKAAANKKIRVKGI